MGVILQNTSKSTYGSDVVCEIIDVDGGSEAVHFDILAPGWSTEWLPDKQNVFDYIIPSMSRCNIILNTAESLAFFTAMRDNEEGRFFVKITYETWTWVGKIIVEDMTLDDELEPVFTFSAIDGLTDLKGIDYIASATFISVREHIITCLNQLPTIDYLENQILYFQSDIVPNVAVYDGNILEVTYLNNYFYRTENKEKRNFSCYDVLEELCKRLNVNLRIHLGGVWMLGLEGIHKPRLTQWHIYNKAGTYVASSAILETNIELDTYALAGGVFNYISGYKRIVLEADKIFSNRFLGDAIYWNLVYNTQLTQPMKEIGKAKADVRYKVRINFFILTIGKIDDAIYTQPYCYVKMNLGVVGGSLIATDKQYSLPTTPGKYYYEYIIESTAADRDIEASFEIVSPIGNLLFMDLDVNVTMTETAQIYDKIKTISTITGSTNPKIKTVQMYGNHHNGNDAVRFYYTDGVVDVETTKLFKFSGDAGSVAYEQLIAEHMLKYSGNLEVLELPYNRVIVDDFLMPYIFRTVEYYPMGVIKNYHVDTSRYILAKISDAQAGAIDTEYEVPLSDDANEPTSSIIGNIQLYLFNYYEEFENVTADYITPTDDLSEIFVDITEIKRFWSIYVNGVLQQYIDVAGVSYPPEPGELNMYQYTYFAATNRMYFGQPLEDCFIQIKHSRA